MHKLIGLATKLSMVGALAYAVGNPVTAGEQSALGGASINTDRSTQVDNPDLVTDPVGGQGETNTKGQKAGCMLCGGVILSVGIASIGGLALVSAFLPEVVAGCAFLCVLAFS